MNIKFNSILNLLGLLVILSSVGCNDEDYTGLSTVTVSSPNVELVGPVAVELDEEDSVINYVITLSEPQSVNVVVNVAQTGGSATEDEDFELSAHAVEIPANSLSGSFSVVIYAGPDSDEGEETIEITVGESLANANFTPVKLNYTINDIPRVLNNYVDFTVEWDSTVMGQDFCSLVDIDVYVLDVEDTDGILSPDEYDGSVLGYDAATGDCPEGAQLSDLDNGTYYIYAAVYSSFDAGTLGPITIPVSIYYNRSYNNGDLFAEASFDNFADAITSETPVFSSDDNSYHGIAYLGKVIVEDGNYTAFDAEGNSVSL